MFLGRSPRPARHRAQRLHPRLSRYLTDLLPQDRRRCTRTARQSRRNRAQASDGPPAAREPKGGRGAIRIDADWLECDGVQAEPDAERAGLLVGEASDRAPAECADDGGHAVV